MVLDPLFEQLKNPNPNLRQRARAEIVMRRDANTIPRLMANLEQEDMTYRRASVKTLGLIGVDSVPSLVDSLINGKNPTIRASCAKALAQVAVNHKEVTFPQEGIDALESGMNDPDPVVHLSSVMALGAVGVPAVDPLIKTLESTDNLAVGVAIINALGGLNDERVPQVLTKLSNDESADPYIKESATSALSRLEMVMKYASVNEERANKNQ
ncbi:MAG: HEAT repeat domain-containing protein [Cyanobacteria bacterium P01_F01_bin.143]